MNFGESLAYWYFRLNGFIPMTNFVLHRLDAPRRYNADADLLAIRFPHVFEEIGGKKDDWDHERFETWGLDHRNRTVCIISEIKTGRYTKDEVNKAFSDQRVRYALQRMGVIPRDECDAVCSRLAGSAVVQHREFSFAKVLMASTGRRVEDFDGMTQCCEIELEEAVDFIKRRMSRYPNEKEAARMFFSGDLIQFFAWSAGVQLDEQNAEVKE